MAEITKEDIAACKPDCAAGAATLNKAINVGIAKATNKGSRLFALAMMAGVQIGLGALFMTYVKADHSLSFAAASVLGGLCFSLGLICVIVAGSELFTGNNLMVIAWLQKKITFKQLMRNWGIVWLGNFVGSLILVLVVVGCASAAIAAGDNTVGNQMVAVASGKINLTPLQIFCRGIGCNLLVCLAVWMGFCGRTVIDKIFTAIFPVMAFVALGFEHCVANMFFLPMGYVASLMGYGTVGVLSLGGICINIIFATLGNIVGGSIFVGVLYWFSYRAAK